MSFILAYDLGTSGNKATLFDLKLNPLFQASINYPLYYPKLGWAEQKPADFWNSVKKTTEMILNGYNFEPNKIKALAFTCQMNCTIPIDKKGDPLMNCISWLDTRASELIQQKMKGLIKFKGVGLKKTLFFKKHTGGAPGKNGKDPISHIMWIKNNLPEIYQRTFRFLSVKDFVIFKCTNTPITSRDLANTSWLKARDTDEYSEKVLKITKIDIEKLPIIKKSTDIAGNLTEMAAKELKLVPGIPVFVGSGDLTTVALGSGGILDNQVIICLGTADWVGTHISKRKTDIPHYIGTINSAQDNFLYISKQETGAACFNWIVEEVFKDVLEEFKEDKAKMYQKFDSIVENTEPGSKKLLFAPWMFGERSPINNSEMRGGFLNLSLNHKRNDLLRAVYEGIAFNLKWSLDPIEKALGKCKNINLIGGAASSDVWCQIIADILGKDILRMNDPNLGGTRGAAIIAMVGLGILKNFKDAIPLIHIDKSFKPNIKNKGIYKRLYQEYVEIYKRNKKMFKNLNS